MWLTRISASILSVAVLGFVWWGTTPRYIVINEKMSLSVSSIVGTSEADVPEDFAIKPQKVLVTNLWKFRPLTVPVTIENGEGFTEFIIEDVQPPQLDEGYRDADGKDYTFSVSKKSVKMEGNTRETIYVTVDRKSSWRGGKVEKGIAVIQTIDLQGLSIVRRYIFEILIP